MDEPTNHLDMQSKDILKTALNNYDGTLIIVSHDRNFLQGLSQKVYEFKNKNIKEYLGDINDFLEQKEVNDFKQFETQNASTKTVDKSTISDNKMSYNAKKQLDRDIRKATNRISKLEKQVDALENELKQLDIELARPETFKELSSQKGFFDSYQQRQDELNKRISEWEESITILDELKAKRTND